LRRCRKRAERILLEEHEGRSLPNHKAVVSSETLLRKPGNVSHNTLLANGILQITLLIKKYSGMVMSTAIPHLSSG
jgi:hypothetical protein